MSGTFGKTRKGQEEITARSGGLAPRVRRLLILVDGKRDVAALRSMVGEAGFDEQFEHLQQQGYIEPLQESSEANAPPQSLTQASAGAVHDVHHGHDAARNFMLNALADFTGSYRHRALLAAIRDSASIDELRNLGDEWLAAIIDSPAGGLAGDEMKAKLASVLGDA